MNNYFDDLYSEVYEYTYDTIMEKKTHIGMGRRANNQFSSILTGYNKNVKDRKKENVKTIIKYIAFMIVVYKIAVRLLKKTSKKEDNKSDNKSEEVVRQYGEDIDHYKKELSKYGDSDKTLIKYIELRIEELDKMKKMLQSEENAKDIKDLDDEKTYLQYIKKIDKIRRQDIPLMEKLGIRKELIKKLKNGWNPDTGRQNGLLNFNYKFMR